MRCSPAIREHALLRRFAETVDGEYQNLGAKDGAYNRENFFKKDADFRRWSRT